MTVLDSVRTGAKRFAWFFKGVMGEDAYEKYAAHHAAVHAARLSDQADSDQAGSDQADSDQMGSDQACTDQPLMTEREFWRDQTDRQENNPQGRCC